jgi:HK97 family phage prohead protease
MTVPALHHQVNDLDLAVLRRSATVDPYRVLVGLAVPFDTELLVNDPWFGETYVEVFRHGSFTKTIKDRRRPVPLLAHHQSRQFALGHATRVEQRREGLWVRFSVADTPAGNELLELVAHGSVSGLSIGFDPVSHRSDYRVDPPLVERTEVRLVEVSACNFPAFESTSLQPAAARRRPMSVAEARALIDRPAPRAPKLAPVLSLDKARR